MGEKMKSESAVLVAGAVALAVTGIITFSLVRTHQDDEGNNSCFTSDFYALQESDVKPDEDVAESIFFAL